MKKLLAITALVTFVAGAAFAYGPYGYGYMKVGQGYGMMRGKGFGAQAAVNPLSEADAKKAVESYLATNLKGFSIQESQKVTVPRGTAYFYKVSDGKNTFEIHVNPFGNVAGPFPIASNQ